MTELRDLRLDLWNDGDTRHAQVIMRELGIEYVFAVPQSMFDCWWFLGCKNVPDVLPKFITDMKMPNPHDAVGHGLSPEMADRLIAARAEAAS